MVLAAPTRKSCARASSMAADAFLIASPVKKTSSATIAAKWWKPAAARLRRFWRLLQISGAMQQYQPVGPAGCIHIMGERMKSPLAKVGVATLATALMTTAFLTQSTYAQTPGGGGGGGGRKQHQQKDNKPTSAAPRADEKAYNAALKSLPNKPYDPWRGAR